VTVAEDRWVLALDALEAHDSALLLPPTDLGPLPQVLAARAAALLDECRAREDDLTGEMSRLSEQIGRQPQHRDRSGPLFLDQSL
jgi:hypothetical protein